MSRALLFRDQPLAPCEWHGIVKKKTGELKGIFVSTSEIQKPNRKAQNGKWLFLLILFLGHPVYLLRGSRPDRRDLTEKFFFQALNRPRLWGMLMTGAGD
jgi:hypothetical protein